jgi:hypothetical protein
MPLRLLVPLFLAFHSGGSRARLPELARSLLKSACLGITNLSGTYGVVGQPCVHTQGSV